MSAGAPALPLTLAPYAELTFGSTQKNACLAFYFCLDLNERLIQPSRRTPSPLPLFATTPMDNSAAQADFLAKVMKVDAAKYSSIWAKKGFREGINPPPVRGGDSEVISAVKNTPGAIGYVTKAPADVKVIQKY